MLGLEVNAWATASQPSLHTGPIDVRSMGRARA
jgi:hypothetical protein